MRKQAELANEKLQDLNLPAYREGSAEHTGLSNSCCDAIVVAQAYHWFNQEPTLNEFVRILKPGAWVILLWNLRSDLDAFTKAYGELMCKCDEAYAKMESGQLTAGKEFLKNNLLTDKEKFVFANEQIMDEETFRKRVFSVSYIPKDPKRQEWLLQEVKALFKKYQNDGLVTMKYDLELYVGRRP